MSKKLDFAYNVNIPGGGDQGPPIKISEDQPIYSSYTGQLIGYGGIPYGTICDAQVGTRNHGMTYHAIVYNPLNNSYMAHRDNSYQVAYQQSQRNRRPSHGYLYW